MSQDVPSSPFPKVDLYYDQRLHPDHVLHALYGTKIIEKRQMHKNVIDYAPPTSAGTIAAGGYHTHVLSDVPEDTDVLFVLTRKPRVPEFVGAGQYMYTISVDGKITVADRLPAK
jgi:hypothetical protein